MFSKLYSLSKSSGKLLFLIFVLVSVSRVFAQDDHGQLVIKVLDDNGAPIPQATIQVSSLCENPTQCADTVTCSSRRCDCKPDGCRCCIDVSAITNEEGVANFSLPAGIYNAKVTSTGFSAQEKPAIQISKGETKTEIISFKVSSSEPVILPATDTENREKEQIRYISGKVVGEDNKPLANVTVRITNNVCERTTVSCPTDITCNSGRCDCRTSPCICCIDVSITTDAEGKYKAQVTTGNFDVEFFKNNQYEGKFNQVVVKTDDKKVQLGKFKIE